MTLRLCAIRILPTTEIVGAKRPRDTSLVRKVENWLMLPRTQRQKEILEYISSFIERHGYEPSYAQIARHFNVKSKATIAKHIAALEKRGLLSRHHSDGAFGMCTMEQSLHELVQSGAITIEDALSKANHPQELKNLARIQ